MSELFENAEAPIAPLIIEERTRLSEAVPRLTMLTLAIAVLLAPTVLIAANATEPAIWLAKAGASPMAALSVAASTVLAVTLFALPLLGLLARVASHRRVVIAEGNVVDTRHSVLGGWRTETPLAEFRGVAHVVRTTLSGAHHELVLVHADRRRNIVLQRADAISRPTIEHTLERLARPELPARAALA
jgi:cytochrome b561